jgi:SAM-dependent methyltransferase
MSAAALLETLTARACPVCGSTDDSQERFSERIDPARLGALSYSSRKEPEYMRLRLVICPSCELLYAPRIPDRERLARAYEATGYEGAEEAGYAAASYAEAIRRRLRDFPEARSALEIGTGNGALLKHLRALGFAQAIGIEPSIEAVRAAEPEVAPLIRVESFDPARLPIAEFSLVIANQTLEHVAEPLSLLGAARALLRPGGALMIVSHDYRHPLMRLLGARSPIIDIEHLQLFSRRSLRRALEQAGFTAIDVGPFANRYPLHYWLRLAPLPRILKRVLHASLRQGEGWGGRVGRLTLRASVGNMIAWARADSVRSLRTIPIG